jgi:enolase
MSRKIVSIRALEILDSRGNPTLRAYVSLDNGITTAASVPSGASTGVGADRSNLRPMTTCYEGNFNSGGAGRGMQSFFYHEG